MTNDTKSTAQRHKAAGFPPAPSWHELVQPGPNGDPQKALKRAEAVRHGATVQQDGTGVPRSARRAAGNRGTVPGRLVRDGGPRPDVERRRALRAGRSS